MRMNAHGRVIIYIVYITKNYNTITNSMKRFINFLMLMLALVIAPMTVQADKTAKTEPNVERYNVSDNNGLLAFGKSYYEVDGRPVGANGNYYSTEHSNWSMKSWPKTNNAADATKHVVTYIHFPTCSTDAQIQLTTTGNVTFVVKVYCMENPETAISTKTVNITKTGQQWITVMNTQTFSQKAWYKFDIQCTSGAANVGEFTYWKFSKDTSLEPAYTADYMSSPSVHLNGWHTTDPSVPSASRYDWTYQEVMIPEGDDIVGTYCMSLGVLHGYMGIQKDSETDYPIIFSMWDNGSTDNDPNLPDYLRSGALDAGEGVTIARFGGEGTGAQAKFRTSKNWEPGKWVKFLCNARPEIVDVEVDDPDHPGQKKTITYSNTLTSAWVWADGIDTDWRYIATIRQSGANNYMDGWYSFLEDYNWPSGQWKRNAYYRRGGLHSMVTGKWYNANNVGFGHTDGGNTYGDRDDYGHGKTTIDGEEAFYLTSGGYHENVTDTENTLTLITDFEGKIGAPISQTTLTNLLGRVDQAIKKEQGTKLAEDFENSRETLAASGFTVVYVNSEATNEGDANKKEAAIDGNENTYWHSRWSGGSSTERNYPFYIDIQLSEEMQAKEIEQIAFVFRTGNKSYVPKKLQLQYSSNNSTWTPYSEVYDIADAATSTVNLTTKVTGKKYLRLYFAEGYSDCLAIKEIYFRTAVGRDALNEQVQAILDKENRFDGYSTSDLAALKTAFNSGNWTDENAVRTALLNLAANGTLLKYGVANGTNAISSFKAYQLYNAKGLGDLVVENSAPAVKADADVNVTLDANNWQLLRSEKWNAYYLYNASAEKYLAFENSTAVLTDKPTPVYVGTRSSGGNFEGFTFQFDLANANSFLTANGTSATLGASNTNGAVWQLRDNYGITPAAVNVNELLAEADEEGAPEGFDGEGYTIRLNNTNLYLSTIEVDDKGKSTYSLSTYPEYFKVVSTGNKTYTLQSATSKKYVGYTGAPTSWDVVNHADNWTIADIEGGVTTIIKSGSQGLGANSNEQAAGHGVYTNKTDTHQWIFTYFEGSGEEPEDDGLIKMSTSTEKYYYTIRNNNNPGNYAHYAGASANLALNSTKNASAVFYFTPASDYSESNIAVNIHNATAGNLVMNDWASWGSTPSLTWYISDATGTTGQTNDWNIRRTNSGNNYWNHQSVGVASWSAGGDRGSGWYLEPVTPIELDVQINGTGDTNAGVTYNGTLYKTGQHITAFFASAGDFVPAEVSGMAATVTIYEGTAYVDYEVCDPFFSTSTTNANYHKIVFKNGGGNVAIDDALNTSSHIITASRTDATAWAFIGTIDNFVLCSQDGKYVKIADDRLAETETASEATTFKIVVNKEGGYYGITPSSGGNGFNCWSGIGTNHEIGFYGVNDSGSQLLFYNATGTEQEAPRLVEEEYTVTGATAFNKPSKHTLWYDQPAGTSYNNWMEYSLPIGNGELGGSIYGGVKTDKITLNEKSFWDGASVTRGNPNHGEYLKVGNVWVKNLSNAFDSGVKNYVRYLDIDNAVAGVQYADNDGTQYERVAFSSQPEKVMAVRYTATGTNKLHLNFTLEPGGQLTSLSSPAPAVAYRSNGSHAGNATFNGKLETLTYAAQVTVKADDNATVTSNYKGITVENATEITLYYTAGTDFDAFKQNSGFVNGRASQLPADMASRINSTSAKNWSSILDAHKADYKTYYDRVALDIKKSGASVNSTKTTKALVDYYGQSQTNKDSNEGLFLEQLYYNYGRYLLISSNRGESVPNNLQGIWVDTDNGHAPWNSDIHTNINIQMNYWPAEPNNLSDLHKPLLDHIISIADAPGPKAQALAKNQTVGWVINTESNIFGGMSGFSNGYTIANAWYVTHLWQHYRYTLDKTFLRKAFPAMLGAAQYWAERLVKNSTDNLYECPGEWSPEQGPTENATAHSQQLVRELFDNTLAAIQELDAVNQGLVSSSVVTDIQNKRNNLDLGLRTEKYYSGSHNDKNWNSLIADGSDIIREWKTSDYTAGENQHRHTSHLMALYPFSQLSEDVTVGSTTYTADQLFTAAVNSLTQRGDNSTGWAMGWRVNLWARALNGNHARVLLNNALKHARSYATDQSAGGVYYNLWDGHAPFQIDGNFGVCAGISEMLLQSHTGVIQLLPALPDAWAEGCITGLKTVGNFQVDQKWAEGALTKATIVNKHTAAQDLYVKYGTVDLSNVSVTVNGSPVTPVAEGGAYKLAAVAPNAEVVINISGEPEEEEDVPEPSVTATYAPAVYPAQQEIVGEANLDVNVGSTKTTYTFSNEVLAAQFVKKNGTLKFNGSTAMNLKPGTELFTIKFGNGSTVVNASDMTLVGNVETGNLTANTDAVKGAEHFAGKYIQATFTHEYEGSNVTFVWKAELRDGSHYLRTDLTMTTDKDVQMNAIIPMQYDVDAAAAGSTPAVVGNTRGAVLMSDNIFAGLETPTAYNSVISNTTVPEKWSNYKAWTGASDFSWMPSELPSGITDLSSNYTPQTVVGSRGYLKFDTTGSQTITFTYTEGSHKLNIVGVDVLDTDGNIVAHDYHEGRTGGSHANNVYTVNIPSADYYQVRYFISLLAWSESYSSESISSKGNITYSGSVSVPTVVFDLDPVAPASTRRKVLSADHIGNNEDITDTWDTSTNQFQDMNDADVPARIVELGHSANNIYSREQNLNIAAAGGTLTTTFTYKGGSNRLQIVGVDLIDEQNHVAISDYHFGYTGNAAEDNTYSFIVPAAGQYKLRYLVSKQGEALTSNGDIAINYEIIDYLHLPAPAEVSIQGLWSRQATLKASAGDLTDKDVVWNVSSVVGLVDPNHKRRSFLAYSERERAVPWRPFPHYNSWYELNINRNNAAPGSESTNSWVAECTPVVEAWKTNLFDKYNVGIKSFVWDDGWDEYGEWHHHSGFPNGFKEPGQVAVTMNSGIGAWLGPVGGYGQSGNYRRDYWNGKGGMQLSNKAYYDVFKAACTRLVKTEAERDGYEFNFFKFDGISGQFSSVGPDDGATGNENAEGIIGCERYVRENLKADIFFNTTVGTWASPFWYHFSDATWRQENDFGTIGNNSSSRENWITYRDRLVYQNYVQRSPICPINTLMTHGFILHQRENGNFDGVSNDLNYQSVLNELRCAFACGSGMVELYADHRLMTSINGGKLWSDLADCLKWQEANKDVLPDIHWVGGNPWTGSKAEIYGWAAWNGEKATLTLRNGAPSQQTFTTTLRDALDIPASFTGTIQLTAAFADQLGSLATIAGIAEGSDINPDTQITFTLPASSVYVYNGIDSEIAPEPTEAGPATSVVTTFHNEGNTWAGVQFTVNATDADGNAVQNVTASASSSLSGPNQGDGNPKTLADNVGTDKLGINYQTGGSNNQGAVLTLNFDLANLPAGSNFNCISLPMYAVAGGGGYQSDQAGTSEIDVTVTVKEGNNVLYTATKENFNITDQKNGNLNSGLVFNSDTPITIAGTSATVSFVISKGDTNGGCFMALQSLNLVSTRTITFVMGEPVSTTQTVKAPMGQTPVCPVSVPSYVTATYSPALATVTADATYNVSYAYNDGMPFTVGKTYNITLKNLPVSYNAGENKFKDAAADLNDANSQFTIGGDWYHGFTLFNEGAEKYLTYGDNASPDDGTHAVTTETLNTGAHFDLAIKDNYNYFKLHGTTNESYVNDRSGYFATWANASAFGNDGSRLTFTEVEALEEAYETLLVNLSEALIGVYAHLIGYPTEDAVMEIIEEKYGDYETFSEIFEGLDDTTYPTALATYNAILACPYIYLPEDGKAYYFTNVQQKSSAEKVMEGKEYILKFNTSTKELTTEEYIQDMTITDQHYFICHHLGEGKYVFVNNYGYYLRHYANSHGGALSDSYDENNDYIKVVKHATSGNTQPAIDAFFGLVALKGNRPDVSANASIVVNGNTGGFDASGDDFLVRYNAANNQYSTAFKIEEVAYPYNHPKLIKGDDGYYASIYLPFAMQVPEGIECYRGTEDRGNNLALEKMNEDNTPVPAGGYILYTDQTYLDSDPESPTYGQELESIQELVTPADAAPAAVDNLFIGTTAEGDAGELWAAELEGNNPYVLANKSKGIGFYRYTSTAYPKGKAIYLAGSASTRECLGFQFDDIVEAIKTAKGEETDNTVFDLTGRRLDKAAKGVNIVSGKKVLK